MGGGGRHRFVVALTDAFIGSFFCMPQMGIQPETLTYGDDALMMFNFNIDAFGTKGC